MKKNNKKKNKRINNMNVYNFSLLCLRLVKKYIYNTKSKYCPSNLWGEECGAQED